MATSLATILMTLATMAMQQSDTTVTVEPGARLAVEVMGGSISIDTWDRPEVRVQADHNSRDALAVEASSSVVRIRTERDRGFGFGGIVDYRITVPAAMDLDLSGFNVEIAVDGSRGRIDAESVQGDITVRQAGGAVDVETVIGRVEIDGASGPVSATSVSGGARLRNVTGNIEVESVSGPLIIENSGAERVNASAVAGAIYFDGVLLDEGRYSFEGHSGRITLGVQPDLDATVSVALLSGSFTSSFEELSEGDTERGRRRTTTLGGGSARLEVETFSGTVHIGRRGEVEPPAASAGGSNRSLIGFAVPVAMDAAFGALDAIGDIDFDALSDLPADFDFDFDFDLDLDLDSDIDDN